MGIEWYRDLSITILCFMTTAMLIFAAIIILRLYKKITATLALVQKLLNSVNNVVVTVEEVIKTTSQNINDTLADVKNSMKQVSSGICNAVYQVQECIKPLLSIQVFIKSICDGFGSIKNMFKKANNEGGGNNNE
jgi:hypothetical protein